ncbi:hypothetical protein [Bowmanella dokdonensis]|uniref:Uncharacterized protein n=1 Tax=Bowmanella dokdonensis TaxID=751969 RepID=A0A939DNW2_9ALTE|nr:hypothetical protein [Bowmanella dokdonensis]MBN7826029.1 hypothetical protein [Bowmanella dokdonensis]
MSVEARLEEFCGQFKAFGDLPDTSDPGKEPYYPAKGTITSISKVEHQGRWVAKIESSDPSVNSALAEAYYFLVGNRLVSTPIEVQPGLSFTEVVEWTSTRYHMNHYLLWSDGELGSWKCGPD